MRAEDFIIYVVITGFLGLFWNKLRCLIPDQMKKAVMLICFGLSAVVCVHFFHDNFSYGLMGILMLPMVILFIFWWSASIMFGRHKKWLSFGAFLSEYKSLDGFLFMSIMMLYFEIVMEINWKV